jgi:hypothetical protein
MIKRASVFCIAVLFFHCNNVSQHPGASFCDTPIDRACANDTCCFVNIYNIDTVLIAEDGARPAGGKFVFAWDGKDKNGNLVGCGSYIAKMTTIVNGKSTTRCMPVAVTDSNSTSAHGRSACDSLRGECTGNYFEFQADAFPDSGVSEIDTGCICCK